MIRRTSLLRRILQANLLVAFVAIVSLTGLFLAGYRAEFERQQTVQARMLAQFVARQSGVPALIGDRESLEKIAAQAASGDEVLLVRIRYRGSSEDVVARGSVARKETGKAWVEAAEEIRPVRTGLLDWDDGDSRPPESLGRVQLRLSRARADSVFQRTAQQSILVAGTLMALVVCLQFVRMRNLIRPLEELVAFTRRVGIGGLGERTRTDQAGEIADVAIAFNQMMDRLSGTTVSRDYVDNIIHSMAECLIVVDNQGLIRKVNEAALRLLGYRENELTGQHGSVLAGDDLFVTVNTVTATERLWRTRNGSLIPVLFSSAELRRTELGGEGMVWLALDITEQKRVREDLLAARERYALAVAGANDGIWDWNVLTQEVYYSPRWKRMLGYDDSELPDRLKTWLELVHPDDRQRVVSEMDSHRTGHSAMFESEHRIRHRDGSYRWMLNRGLGVRGADGRATRIAGSQTDITQNKASDPLTGLPNRVLFTDRLSAAFDRRRLDTRYRFAVMFLDLDRFKLINDSLGHLAGDQLLVGIAGRMQRAVQEAAVAAQSTVARLSGDEFAILLEGIDGDPAAAASSIGAKLIQEASVPFEIDGNEVFTSFSIGVAPDTGDYLAPSEILRDADTAMYRAKAAGKGRCEIFDAEMRAQAVARLELDTDLRRAVERGEFLVYYEPKFAIPSQSFHGFEALVRWNHKRRGLIRPAEFIPLAEDTGLILAIGAFVLQEACRQMRQLQIRYPQYPDMVLSVNLSPRQFAMTDLPESIEKVLVESGLKPSCLSLELTETVLFGDTEKNIVTLNRLKALGIGLKIDDFGTGYSSLNYLHRFPFDTVKIDRSFVGNLDNQEGVAIVRAIISLAHMLGMKVIAEGIETRRQLQTLVDLGCEFGQGYYFSKPVSLEGAERILANAVPHSPLDLLALHSGLARHEVSRLIQ